MPADKSIDTLLPGHSAVVVSETPAPEESVIKVFEETVRVDKRLVETGHAKVRVTVTEHDQAIETLLMRQDLVIDRVRIDRPIDAAPPVRQEGDTIIVSLVEERVVVEKRLFLTEELRIRVDQAEHVDTQTVRLRREQAVIDDHGSANPSPSPSSKPNPKGTLT